MSLVDVYDALKEAKVSDQKAAAAVKAIETVREESRLRRIEEKIGELRAEMAEMRSEIHLLKWMCGGILGLMVMAFIRIMFG